jgi:RNA polymerase sigma-70 factor (ECF subfamily)
VQLTKRERVRTLAQTNSADLLAYFVRRVDNTEDAADLLGETLLVVWRRAGDLPTNDVDARMWMFGIARRLILGYHRGNRRHADLAERLKRNLSDTDPFVEALETRLTVHNALKLLKPNQRELVLLVCGEGFSLAEAASIMRASASTTRSRYAKALSILRSQLAGDVALDLRT